MGRLEAGGAYVDGRVVVGELVVRKGIIAETIGGTFTNIVQTVTSSTSAIPSCAAVSNAISPFGWVSPSYWISTGGGVTHAAFAGRLLTTIPWTNATAATQCMISRGATSNAVIEFSADFPASNDGGVTPAVYTMFSTIFINELSGGYPKQITSISSTKYTNSTSTNVLVVITNLFTSVSNSVVGATLNRTLSGESAVTGTTIRVWGARARTY